MRGASFMWHIVHLYWCEKWKLKALNGESWTIFYKLYTHSCLTLSHTTVIATQYPVHTQKKIIATAPYLNTVTKEEFTHMTQFYSPPKKSIYLFKQ